MHVCTRTLILAVCAATALPSEVRGQEYGRILIAVSDPDPAPAELPEAEARVMGDLLRQFLSNPPRIVVVERARLAEVFRDRAQANRMPGVYDRSTAVRLGRVLEATHFAYGALDRLDGAMQLYYNVVDVATTAIVAGATVRWSTDAGRDSALRLLVRDLTDDLQRATQPAAPAPPPGLPPRAMVTVNSDFPFHVDSSSPGPTPRSRIVVPGERQISAITLGGTIVRTAFRATAGFTLRVDLAIPDEELRRIGTGAVLGTSPPLQVRGFQALGPDLLVVDGDGHLTRVSAYSFERRWYNADCDFVGELMVTDSIVFGRATARVQSDDVVISVPTLCAIHLRDGNFAGEMLRGLRSMWRTPRGVGVRNRNSSVTFIDGRTLAQRQVELRGAPRLQASFTHAAGPAIMVRDSATGALLAYHEATGAFLWERRDLAGSLVYASGDRLVVHRGGGEALVLDPATGTEIVVVRHGVTTADFLSGDGGRVAICSASGHYALFDVLGNVAGRGMVETRDRGTIMRCDLDENGRLVVLSGRNRLVLFDPALQQPVLAYDPDHGIRAVSHARGLAVVETSRNRLVSLGLASNPWFLGWTEPAGEREAARLRLARAPTPADSLVHLVPLDLSGGGTEVPATAAVEARLRVGGPWFAELLDDDAPMAAESFLALPRGRLRTMVGETGGDVWIDGFFLGPARDRTFSISPGPHWVRVERTGLLLLDTLVVVSAGDNPPLLPAPPRLAQATVSFRTVPRDGRVYIDGALLNRSRASIQRPPGTILVVQARRLGYRTTTDRVVVQNTAIEVREYRLVAAEPRYALWMSGGMRAGGELPVYGWEPEKLTPAGPVGEPLRAKAGVNELSYGINASLRRGRLVGFGETAFCFSLSCSNQIATLKVGVATRLLSRARGLFSADAGASMIVFVPDGLSREGYRGPLNEPFTEVSNTIRWYSSLDLYARLGAARFLTLSAGRLRGGDLKGIPVVQTVAGEGESNEGAVYVADESKAYHIDAQDGIRAEFLYATKLPWRGSSPLLQVGGQYTITRYAHEAGNNLLRERSWRLHVGLREVIFRPK